MANPFLSPNHQIIHICCYLTGHSLDWKPQHLNVYTYSHPCLIHKSHISLQHECVRLHTYNHLYPSQACGTSQALIGIMTVYSLQNMHLFPLIEITLTMNWQDGGTALIVAAKNGHSNVVETLLQHGASVDMKKTVSA